MFLGPLIDLVQLSMKKMEADKQHENDFFCLKTFYFLIYKYNIMASTEKQYLTADYNIH